MLWFEKFWSKNTLSIIRGWLYKKLKVTGELMIKNTMLIWKIISLHIKILSFLVKIAMIAKYFKKKLVLHLNSRKIDTVVCGDYWLNVDYSWLGKLRFGENLPMHYWCRPKLRTAWASKWQMITLRVEIFAINFREFFFRTFRGN